eukprot:1186772-Prorocentrum_minimum.AAC.2
MRRVFVTAYSMTMRRTSRRRTHTRMATISWPSSRSRRGSSRLTRTIMAWRGCRSPAGGARA